ncbi:acyltransferase [Cognatiluteimonas profundi]|uniref:LpxL/LpxP family acyltransferase n=1 Tax=Cognatiluteimonas profundi TaxID=2594501 RepID=UPI00131B16EA|nr:acyltransferase [Lysobacter profundi]
MSSNDTPACTQWKQRPEGGGLFAIWLIRGIARHAGRKVARLLLGPITLYFLLMRGPERRASAAYLQRVLGRPARWPDAARHIHTFASTILDRVFLLSGRLQNFQVTMSGLDDVHAQLDKQQGVLLFGSHLGSFEVMRVLARQRPEYVIRVVLDKGHNPAMTQLLDALDPVIAANVIDAAQDGPSLMLAIQQAVSDGHLVALLVDRVQSGDSAETATFLGQTARFPRTPWLIASVLHAPIVLAFGLYRGGNRYDLAFETFSDGLRIPRSERQRALSALIQRYAGRLEHYARLAPFNWFNFYDFWDPSDDAPHDRSMAARTDPALAARALATATDRAAGAVADREHPAVRGT